MRDFGHGHGRGRRGGGRIFGHGGLRLVLLQLIAEQPRHGYELIKDIEERLGGGYSPSPGIVYPTLTMLEELGHATVSDEEGGRKRYAVTDAGRRFLDEQRAVVDELMSRMSGPNASAGRPPQVVRALENFKMAVRMRLSQIPLSDEQANAIVDVLDDAAKTIERIK